MHRTPCCYQQQNSYIAQHCCQCRLSRRRLMKNAYNPTLGELTPQERIQILEEHNCFSVWQEDVQA
ncbi:hypothetical protein PM082_024352 [Marasmius tenuissimus]|nr:hypothetical protein PM082_024352 [Marasmius tenuissimus]